jgi:hypothetical protein
MKWVYGIFVVCEKGFRGNQLRFIFKLYSWIVLVTVRKYRRNLFSVTGNMVEFRDIAGDFKRLFTDHCCERWGCVICHRSGVWGCVLRWKCSISALKGTYCLKCTMVMETTCSSDTSVLVYQIPPFQTPEHRTLQATVWKPQISKVARMFQYTRTSTQTHKNSFWIGSGFWSHLKKIPHTFVILSCETLTRSNFRILMNKVVTFCLFRGLFKNVLPIR